MTQVVERLPRQCETLNSSPGTHPQHAYERERDRKREGERENEERFHINNLTLHLKE
jgi:hypothetical protein